MVFLQREKYESCFLLEFFSSSLVFSGEILYCVTSSGLSKIEELNINVPKRSWFGFLVFSFHFLSSVLCFSLVLSFLLLLAFGNIVVGLWIVDVTLDIISFSTCLPLCVCKKTTKRGNKSLINKLTTQTFLHLKRKTPT